MGDTALILRLREDNQRLLAVVEPGTDLPPLDAAAVREQLAGSCELAKGAGEVAVQKRALSHQQMYFSEAGLLADEVARRFSRVRRLEREHAVLQRQIIRMHGEDSVNGGLELPEVAQLKHRRYEKVRFHRAR